MSGESDLVSVRDWFESGWWSITPPVAIMLQMMISTASMLEVDGDLDRLHREIVGLGDFELDEQVLWTEANVDDPDELAYGAARKSEFEDAVTAAGHLVPETVRDYAELLAAVGVFQQSVTEDHQQRWRIANPLPLPEECLSFRQDRITKFEQIRWKSALEPYAQRLIRHVVDDLEAPEFVDATIERLASSTGLSCESVRQGLQSLSEDEFTFHRHGAEVDPEHLLDHARFKMVIDWQAFRENRFTIRHA